MTVEDPNAMILILDYETHARYEWLPRVEAFGGDLDRIFMLQPSEAIWDLADGIDEIRERYGMTYMVVDSVGYACFGKEVETSGTAIEYSAALKRVGMPTLSLAHTTKAEADPKHPFGSVYWSNGARITIGITGTGSRPRMLTNKKSNQRPPFPPVAIDWAWSETGVLPTTLTERPRVLTTIDRIELILDALGPLTLQELFVAAEADGGTSVTPITVRKALERHPARFSHDDARPRRWSHTVASPIVASPRVSKP